MNIVGESWSSSLPVRDIAQVFRTTAEDLFGTRSRRLLSMVPGRSSAGRMEFFTPSGGETPFAVFDEQPAFAVGVMGPQGGSFNGALLVAIHMYVYDKESHRQVDLVAPYERMKISRTKAETHLQHFSGALRLADPAAQLLEGE